MQQAIIHDVGPKPQCLLVVLVFVGSLHASVALEAHGGSSFVTEPATNFTISSVMRRPFVSKKTSRERPGFQFPRFDARLHDGDQIQMQMHDQWLSMDMEYGYKVRGRGVAMRNARTGKFCAERGIGIECTSETLKESETFEVADVWNGRVTLKFSALGTFCTDSPFGMQCHTKYPSKWEGFKIEDAGHGTARIRGDREGKFCVLEKGMIICNQHSPRVSEETFELISTQHSIYKVVLKDQKAATDFTVVLKDNKISFRCGQASLNLFLAADHDQKVLVCRKDEASAFYFQRVQWWDQTRAMFSTHKGKGYWWVDDVQSSDHVSIDGPEDTDNAVAQILLTGGFQAVFPMLRGVNLGNWFVLEKWMAEDLFYDETGTRPFSDGCSALDEFGLMKTLGSKVEQRMKNHWSTWITKDDIKWIADHGLNAVRVPFGYWMTHPEKPFIAGQLKYLDELFRWCEQYSLFVLLDFRGLKGSSKGRPASGNCGACGKASCGGTKTSFLEHEDANLAVISSIVSRYAASPAFLGLQILDSVEEHGRISPTEVMKFYQKAYDIIRTKSHNSMVVLSSTYTPSLYPFRNFHNVAKDSHLFFRSLYKKMGPVDVQDLYSLATTMLTVNDGTWPTIVGEWSLDDHGTKLAHWKPDLHTKFYKEFGKAQLQAFERNSIGWFYWAYKTQYPNSTWNYRDMCELGWLPSCNSGSDFAPKDWWNTPTCEYKYFTGKCHAKGGVPSSLTQQVVPATNQRKAIPLPAHSSIPAASPLRGHKVFVLNSTDPVNMRGGFRYPRFDARLHDGDLVQLRVSFAWFGVKSETATELRGAEIALRSSNSGYFCGEVDGRIQCNKTTAGDGESFEIATAWGHYVSLKSSKGGHFCADTPQGIICRSSEVARWEAFSIVDLGSGQIGFLGNRAGKYCADEGDRVVCRHDTPDGPEKAFRPVSDWEPAHIVVRTDEDLAVTFEVVRPNLDSPLVAFRCGVLQLYMEANIEKGDLRCSSGKPVFFNFSRVDWWDVTLGTLQVPQTGRFVWAASEHLTSRMNIDGYAGGPITIKFLLKGGYEIVRPLVRGVNFGNWFLLEKWMAHYMFHNETTGKPFEDHCTAIDEQGLMNALSLAERKRRMEEHWNTWITEDDIIWIAARGINSVRVPIGYWMVAPDPPFIEGQFKYLERLFKWCERHGLAVLLDFHGLKGSQQGQATSGNCGACQNPRCGVTHVRFLDFEKENLAVIQNLSTHFSRSPVFLGFEVANEVAGHDGVSSIKTMSFYEKAYSIIRSQSATAIVLFAATFNPPTYPFPNFQNTVKDYHLYYPHLIGKTQKVNPNRALLARSDLLKEHQWPILVGEWSLDDGGSLAHSSKVERKAFLDFYGKAQLQAYEQHSCGWFFWSYKTMWPYAGWDFRTMCREGWVPGCSHSFNFSSPFWWDTVACQYAYLDGRCNTQDTTLQSDGGAGRRPVDKRAITGPIRWAMHPDKCLYVDSQHRVYIAEFWDCIRGHPNMQFIVPAVSEEGMRWGPIRWALQPDLCLGTSDGELGTSEELGFWKCGEPPFPQFILPASGVGPVRWAKNPTLCLQVDEWWTSTGHQPRFQECHQRIPSMQFFIPSATERSNLYSRSAALLQRTIGTTNFGLNVSVCIAGLVAFVLVCPGMIRWAYAWNHQNHARRYSRMASEDEFPSDVLSDDANME